MELDLIKGPVTCHAAVSNRNPEPGVRPMEALVPALLFIVAVAGLVVFDLLALRFGADTRPTIGDDHAGSLRA
jgi:hypothetical protein